MNKKRNLDHYERGFNAAEKWEIVLQLIIFITALFVVMTLTRRLRLAIDRKTQSYVTDVALQNAYRIEEKLQVLQQNLELVKAHVKDELPSHQPIFLQEAAALLGFDSLVIHANDSETGVIVRENQQIDVTVALDEQRQLTGSISQQRMQRMIQSQSFGGQGLSCISDAEGRVIISPTSLEPFLKLDELFVEKRDAQVVADIEQMQARMRSGERGVLQFVARDQTELVLSYIPIHNGQWVLLTLVPAALMSREVDLYAFWNYIVLALLLIFCGLILMLSLYRNWKHRRRLGEIAFMDPLTRAPNDSGFRLLCRRQLDMPGLSPSSIVFINLKHFKLINENYRSETGDTVLKIFMECLRQTCGQGELAARIEADHFALLVRGQAYDGLLARLQRLQGQVKQALAAQQIDFTLAFNAGFYAIYSASQDVQVMLGRAKTACWSAEKQELLLCQYDQRLIDTLNQEHAMTGALPGALRGGQFMIVLQPKVDPAGGRVAGAEALVRWKHPEKGMIPPGQFIPILENSGQIVQLDEFVFEQVCALLKRWQEDGIAPLPISVNLSRHHFKNRNFLGRLRSIADHYGVDPGWIELEITESIFFDESSIERVKTIVHQIHQSGFTCSLDDFGSGYSSLGLLKEFEIDAIKLDRIFFPATLDPRSQVVIEGIVALAKNLKLTIVAEGVESSEQADFLRRIGCDLIQGYYYSPPLTLSAFAELRRKRNQEFES